MPRPASRTDSYYFERAVECAAAACAASIAEVKQAYRDLEDEWLQLWSKKKDGSPLRIAQYRQKTSRPVRGASTGSKQS
jgi:hypothetical protein